MEYRKKGQARVIRVIRMTQELKDVIDATAAKHGLTVAKVIRAVAMSVLSGRPSIFVADAEKIKTATKSGPVVVNVEAGITLPDMMNAENFRRAIYRRCMEELSRPVRPRRAAPAAVEGIDYNVPDAVAAAKLLTEAGR